MPDLSIAMIGVDERAQLAKWIHSPGEVPFLKQVVYVDTGSTDDSKAVAEKAGAEVHDFEWCDDFSAAKNRSVELCDSEWVLQLDCDEAIDPGFWPIIEQLIGDDSKQYYNVTIWNFEEDRRRTKTPMLKYGKAPRLFRKNYRYGLRYPVDGKTYPMLVHERLMVDEKNLPDAEEIAISHYGYLIERPEPNELYRRLNLAQLELTPFSWRHHFFLSVYEFWYHRFHTAIQMIDRALMYSWTFWDKDGYPMLIERRRIYVESRAQYAEERRQRLAQTQGAPFTQYK